jgi:hypothetical protein
MSIECLEVLKKLATKEGFEELGVYEDQEAKLAGVFGVYDNVEDESGHTKRIEITKAIADAYGIFGPNVDKDLVYTLMQRSFFDDEADLKEYNDACEMGNIALALGKVGLSYHSNLYSSKLRSAADAFKDLPEDQRDEALDELVSLADNRELDGEIDPIKIAANPIGYVASLRRTDISLSNFYRSEE